MRYGLAEMFNAIPFGVAVDVDLKLSDQVREVQSTAWYSDPTTGRPVRFACFLSGDGKAMQGTHHTRGAKCWTCALDVADSAALPAQPGSPLLEVVEGVAGGGCRQGWGHWWPAVT